jgi:hypothetical protein
MKELPSRRKVVDYLSRPAVTKLSSPQVTERNGKRKVGVGGEGGGGAMVRLSHRCRFGGACLQ